MIKIDTKLQVLEYVRENMVEFIKATKSIVKFKARVVKSLDYKYLLAGYLPINCILS